MHQKYIGMVELSNESTPNSHSQAKNGQLDMKKMKLEINNNELTIQLFNPFTLS
jgi:hypothetical protein